MSTDVSSWWSALVVRARAEETTEAYLAWQERQERLSHLDAAEKELAALIEDHERCMAGRNAEANARIEAERRLDGLLHILRNANRIGEASDVPEGSRYIQLSNTLVAQMLDDKLPNEPMATGSVRVVERQSPIYAVDLASGPDRTVHHCTRCGWTGEGSEGCGTHGCNPRPPE